MKGNLQLQLNMINWRKEEEVSQKYLLSDLLGFPQYKEIRTAWLA